MISRCFCSILSTGKSLADLPCRLPVGPPPRWSPYSGFVVQRGIFPWNPKIPPNLSRDEVQVDHRNARAFSTRARLQIFIGCPFWILPPPERFRPSASLLVACERPQKRSLPSRTECGASALAPKTTDAEFPRLSRTRFIQAQIIQSFQWIQDEVLSQPHPRLQRASPVTGPISNQKSKITNVPRPAFRVQFCFRVDCLQLYPVRLSTD
jgi:hypothetical protein